MSIVKFDQPSWHDRGFLMRGDSWSVLGVVHLFDVPTDGEKETKGMRRMENDGERSRNSVFTELKAKLVSSFLLTKKTKKE